MKKKTNLTLWQYLVDIYIPERTKAGKFSQRTAWAYRCKFRRFIEAAGRDPKLTDITEELLIEVEEKLLKSYRKGTARSTRHDVRVVLKHWNPDQFPDHRGGDANVRPQFAEAEIKGTLSQIFVDDYLPERTAISSPATIRQYDRCLQLFSQFLGHECRPADLTDKIVGRFLRWLVEVEGVKPVTSNGYVKQIKSLWNWLAKKRLVPEFPTVAKLKQPDPIPIAWTRDELQILFKACQSQVGFMGTILANLFWTSFYRVLWDTGERTGAMLALQWAWLDLDAGHLTVPGEYRKGGTQPMIYRLKPATIKSLKAIRSPSRELIFDLSDHRSDREYFYSRHRALIKSAGLPYVKGKTGPQKVRRTFASFIEAAGGNATKALKHRDRRVTEDSYLDPKITEVESENKKLFPLDGDEA